MNDWRKPCPHGKYDKHRRQGHLDTGDFAYCPGGSPVTAADLEGEKVWWCEKHQCQTRGMFGGERKHHQCWESYHNEWGVYACRLVERLLIPIPDPQPATEGT